MSLRRYAKFVGVDLGMTAASDETTILRFRHLLEKGDLGGLMLHAMNLHLEEGHQDPGGRSASRGRNTDLETNSTALNQAQTSHVPSIRDAVKKSPPDAEGP